MKYSSGAAFRRALEDRLRRQSLQAGVPLVRLRKMVAFDRLLARLIKESPNSWILKGGLALQLRMEQGSRTTKDIDLLNLAHQPDIYRTLMTACKLDLQDWFVFEVARSAETDPGDLGGRRFPIQALLDGRIFEEFHLDIGVGDPVVGSIEYHKTPPLLEFAGIEPIIVPCYPITQQIAEKVHALTRTHPRGEGSRVKDLVDILLLAEIGEIDGNLLSLAFEATFDARQTHPLPKSFPEFPTSWAIPFRKLADEVELNHRSIQEANNAIKKLLDPILSGETQGRWDPVQWTWNYG